MTTEETRQHKLNRLREATSRLINEEAAKKRDSKIHTENIKAIKEEIVEIMAQLGEAPGSDTDDDNETSD